MKKSVEKWTKMTTKLPSEILGCKFGSKPDKTNDELQSAIEPPEFTFETDHEALRNNPDYVALLRTFAILQAQKIQAVKDIDGKWI